MENQLTIEQAVINVKVLAEKYVGTKQEHLAIEQSILLIEKELKKEDGNNS